MRPEKRAPLPNCLATEIVPLLSEPRCALYGVSLQRQLIEVSDLEARIAAVEQALAEGRLRRIG